MLISELRRNDFARTEAFIPRTVKVHSDNPDIPASFLLIDAALISRVNDKELKNYVGVPLVEITNGREIALAKSRSGRKRIIPSSYEIEDCKLRYIPEVTVL